ncbi:MAG: leucyl aminopeptidase [Rickettsiales bacterium]|jgi:leucyl aminopeptidase|nr:leucyl aminopeptidase [Rickettsiales bacterium]
MKVNFRENTPESGALVSLYTKKFLKNNRELFSKYTFEAGQDERIILYTGSKISVLTGLGDANSDVELERSGWKLLRYLRDSGLGDVALELNNGEEEDSDDKLFSLLMGMELSDYKFDKYLSEEKRGKATSRSENLTLVVRNREWAEAKYREFSVLRENVFFCRDLVNEPPNVINPESYSGLCMDLEKYGLKVEMFGERQIEEIGMNLLLSVGKGSSVKSKVVLLKWQGLEEFKNPIALVGKGVTFDSGGISLKPGNAMYDMKCDMSGSAAVVSSMKLLAQRKARLNAIGIIGLVENMPAGNATKPGDIIRSLSGQTVEVLNTDAEGRMVLADLLYYVTKNCRPNAILDLATLTGAMLAATGPYRAGLFSNNEGFAEEIFKAAEATGEYCWKMPLDKIGGDYDKMMDSDVADMKNISTAKHSGAITAAQFLQRFIDKHPKWAHLDIAGPAFVDDKKCFFVNSGATGYGVRLIDNLLRSNYEN